MNQLGDNMKIDHNDGIVRSEVKRDKDILPLRLTPADRKMINNAKTGISKKYITCLNNFLEYGRIYRFKQADYQRILPMIYCRCQED
jgi:hypothetical protein